VVGSMAAAATNILLPDLPPYVLIPLCFLAAMAAGALWSAIVAVLKIRWGINEVLSMIMFNWIAYYLSNFCVLIPAIHSDSTHTGSITPTLMGNSASSSTWSKSCSSGISTIPPAPPKIPLTTPATRPARAAPPS